MLKKNIRDFIFLKGNPFESDNVELVPLFGIEIIPDIVLCKQSGYKNIYDCITGLPLQRKEMTEKEIQYQIDKLNIKSIEEIRFRLMQYISCKPCPCGNYGRQGKICTCDIETIKQWTEK